MHELAIAQELLEVVRAEAQRRASRRLLAVGVRVGELSGVDPEALAFAFEVLVKGTEFEPVRLEIEFCPRRQRCPVCNHEFTPTAFETACPQCAHPEASWTGGDDLALAYLEVEEP